MSQRSLRNLETTLQQVEPDLGTNRGQRAIARSSVFVRDEILGESTPNMDDIVENANIPDPENPQSDQAETQESETESQTDVIDNHEEEAANIMADLLLQARSRVARGGEVHSLVEEI